MWVFAVIDVWSRLWPSTMASRPPLRARLALCRTVSDPLRRKETPMSHLWITEPLVLLQIARRAMRTPLTAWRRALPQAPPRLRS